MTLYDWIKRHFSAQVDAAWCAAAFIILKSRKFLVDDEDLNGGVQYCSEILAKLLAEKTGQKFVTRNQILVELQKSGRWPLLVDEVGPTGWMILDPGPQDGVVKPPPEGAPPPAPRQPYMRNPEKDWSRPPMNMLLPVEVDGEILDYWINPVRENDEQAYRRQKREVQQTAEKILKDRAAQGWLTSDSFLVPTHPGTAKINEVSASMQAAGAVMDEKYYNEKDLRGSHPHGT